MARTAASFKRAKPRFRPQPTVLVLCEDSKSGKCYLDDASRHFRADVHVEIAHCGKSDPKGIVAAASSRKKQFDRIFCVLDRDQHAHFDAALDLAKAHDITVIASYPCFEFWLLLHFGYSRKPYAPAGGKSAADWLIKDLRTQLGMDNYAKDDAQQLFARLQPRLVEA